MTPMQRRLTGSAIAATATGLLNVLIRLIDGRPFDSASAIGAALGAGLLVFVAWRLIDERWSRRDRADDPKRLAYLAAGLAVGIGSSLLPRLTGISDFGVFVILCVVFIAALGRALWRKSRHGPPAG